MGASAPLAKSSSIRPENLTGQAKKVWSMFTLKRKSLSMPSLAEALRGCADALPTAVTHFVNGALSTRLGDRRIRAWLLLGC